MDLSKHKINRRRRLAAYSLVEVLVASSLLAMAVAASCVMSLTMATQEDMNYRVARNLSLHENAARLYQLGLNSGEIASVLPLSDELTLTYAAASTSMIDHTAATAQPNLGTIPGALITATIKTTPDDSSLSSTVQGWTNGARRTGATGSRATRVETLTVFRADPLVTP